MSNFTLSDNGNDDVIDSRDIVERIEELEAQKQSHEENEADAPWTECDEAELVTLQAFVEEIEQYAGDKASDGITCVEDSHFEDYMDEFVADCYGDMYSKNLPSWMTITLDYDALKQDYTPCDLDGRTYWIR